MVIDKFDDNSLQAVCDVLGDTGGGLTGTEINKLLTQLNINDVEPGITKRHRLFAALKNKQKIDKCGNNVIAFIQVAMAPIRYAQNKDTFLWRKNELNVALAFLGYELSDDGKIKHIKRASTISQAEGRANKLRQILLARNVHPDILKFCIAELLQDNYFHAVFEATKSVADKIRNKAGLTGDGSEIVDRAFGGNAPILAINSLQLETERSEQKGFTNLIKGVFGLFRNVTAHAPKIQWKIEEHDALDLLVMLSYIHRKLDNAVETGFNR